MVDGVTISVKTYIHHRTRILYALFVNISQIYECLGTDDSYNLNQEN